MLPVWWESKEKKTRFNNNRKGTQISSGPHEWGMMLLYNPEFSSKRKNDPKVQQMGRITTLTYSVCLRDSNERHKLGVYIPWIQIPHLLLALTKAAKQLSHAQRLLCRQKARVWNSYLPSNFALNRARRPLLAFAARKLVCLALFDRLRRVYDVKN